MASRREQVNRVEPKLKWCTGVLKGRSRTRIDVMAAEFAAESGALGQLVKLGRFIAFRAYPSAPKSQIHDMQKTSVIIRELIEKLFNRQCLSHMPSYLGISYGKVLRASRGYIPVAPLGPCT